MTKTFICATWMAIGLLALALWLPTGETYGQGPTREQQEFLDAANRFNTLYDQGRYQEALPFAKKAVKLGELEFGANHPNFVGVLNNLAGLYGVQGRYAEAEPLYKRALEIREKVLGLDHPDVGQSLNDLALVYHAQGRYAEAEPLYKRALPIQEKALGPDHPTIGRSLNNLALLYGTGPLR